DRPDDADRLAARVAQNMLAEWDGLAFQLASEAAEVADDVGRALRLRARLRPERIARFLGDDAGQLLDTRFNRIGDLLQHAAALARNDAAPALERLGRGRDCAVDVFGPAARDAGDRLAVARTLDDDLATAGAVGPLAVDQHLGAPGCRRSRILSQGHVELLLRCPKAAVVC